MDVYLSDGTYEVFRYFYVVPAAANVNDQEIGAICGVLTSDLSMIERGASHIGVATDHVVESFRNDHLGNSATRTPIGIVRISTGDRRANSTARDQPDLLQSAR